MHEWYRLCPRGAAARPVKLYSASSDQPCSTCFTFVMN